MKKRFPGPVVIWFPGCEPPPTYEHKTLDELPDLTEEQYRACEGCESLADICNALHNLKERQKETI